MLSERFSSTLPGEEGSRAPGLRGSRAGVTRWLSSVRASGVPVPGLGAAFKLGPRPVFKLRPGPLPVAPRVTFSEPRTAFHALAALARAPCVESRNGG
eukprot:925982-Rhodomonas_salina.1